MSDGRRPAGIDPRAPRFAASVTAVLLLAATFLALIGSSTARATASFGWFAYQPLADTDVAFVGGSWLLPSLSIVQRAADPGFVLVLVIAVLFLWGVLAPRTQPWSVLYRRLLQPRLAAPRELEDPRPPRFAQGVGLVVTVVGLALHIAGVPWALPIAAALAFAAAFLNAVFGLCLGCQLYLLLQRIGFFRPAASV
ncbi:DUF4395 family protein [Microbacterium dextranolyticum]|uniref:DUF4395 domain-containing protein n=1 Tax=Microbacterium dextranolyticum TaxID=36806 RepID=A0A9W6HQI7_9MICO|nr:DUF4395 family protein [Microbacterium dextranolyticum]MBM7462408.1 hypothetical protein [Microbacterium dextranolyticum]GLJ96759.1 hypothetical protein GCM10017591_28220 [Microbacterium dextranolyticum]